MLDSQEAFTGVTTKGSDLETGAMSQTSHWLLTCHDRIGVDVTATYLPQCAPNRRLGGTFHLSLYWVLSRRLHFVTHFSFSHFTWGRQPHKS